MVDLVSELGSAASAESVASALAARHAHGIYCCSVGGTSVLAVNPVTREVDEERRVCQQYVAWTKNVEPSKTVLPPHVYSIAGSAYRHMVRDGANQSIVLLGESGSGKSFCCKSVLEMLAVLGHDAMLPETAKVRSGLLAANALLDMMGNAAIVGNGDSSRLGRYVQCQFDRAGKIAGAKFHPLLLDTYRLVDVPKGERNYGIFYQLFDAPQETRASLRLHDMSRFRYLSSVKAVTASATFSDFECHLRAISVDRFQQDGILQVLAAVLHLGNVLFCDNAEFSNEPCGVENLSELSTAAKLLGVAPADLQQCLTCATNVIRGESCSINLSTKNAASRRDALARFLYSQVLSWIVSKANSLLCISKGSTFLGVLDFPGFQDQPANHFEQLIINSFYERLQQSAVHRMFSEKAALLDSESIPRASGLSFPDTTALHSLLFDYQLSVFSVANAMSKETFKYKDKTDSSFVKALATDFQGNPAFDLAKKGKSRFIIHHSAGTVEYDASGFVNRNAVLNIPDFEAILAGDNSYPGSSNAFVRELFAPQSKSQLMGYIPQDQGAQTVAQVLDRQFSLLLGTMAKTTPWYILCVKPNEDLADGSFDKRTVRGQIATLSVPQIIQDRFVSDFSAVYTFDEFISKFSLIWAQMDLMRHGLTDAEFCLSIGEALRWEPRDMTVGLTKVFLSERVWRFLDDRHTALELNERRNALISHPWTEMPQPQDDVASSGLPHQLHGQRQAIAPESDSPWDHVAPSLPGDLISVSGARVQDLESGGPVTNIKHETPKQVRQRQPRPRSSPARRRWLCITWCLTWWMPEIFLSCCGRMKRSEIRMAWREKLALCIIIFLLNAAILFFIIVFGMLLCPSAQVLSKFELSGYTSISNPLVSAYGRVFKIPDIVSTHIGTSASDGYGMQDYEWETYLGTDVSSYFYKRPLFTSYCPSLPEPQAAWDNLSSGRPSMNSSTYPYHHAVVPSTGERRLYLEYMNQFAVSRLAWQMSYISSQASPTTKLIVIFDNVYDVSSYSSANNNFLGSNVNSLFTNFYGRDATAQWRQIQAAEGRAAAAAYLNCMNNMFYIGTVDHRDSLRCRLSNYVLLASAIVVILVIGAKFLAALQFPTRKDPENHDKFVICQVPCYTEGEESLTRTLESLALLQYDDFRKLILIVSDGMVVGSGNDRPTPQIVLDILGVDPSEDPEPKAFRSVGEGDMQLNFAKVYSGIYEVQGRRTPFVLVVKVGKPTERTRPGNRGKRDSQLILMRFLCNVHTGGGMTPLEHELHAHFLRTGGADPAAYEYVLMVDADTEVFPDSLNRLVSCMVHDARIMGLCGETTIANEKDSWITMIQ
ncbi:hypothetical protein HK405_007309, partial [Cladochytrium tenue]